jgi:hypothetical protein
MYQPLIWPTVEGNEASGLRATLHAQDLEGSPDALIDRVRRNAELGRNLFGGKVLVDEPQAVELPGAQPRDALLNLLRVLTAADRCVGHPNVLQ